MLSPFRKASIYTRDFWLLALSSFLFFGSFNMIIPELPSFLEKLGGGQYKGYIISLFTLAALMSRPLSGRLTDKVGRVPVMIIGAVVSFVCGILYSLTAAIWFFLLIRFIHGFSTGFKPTGTTAYAADIIPDNKRGEAMGILGLFGNLGMLIGLSLGSVIVDYFSMQTLFFTSSALAITSILILLGMKETLKGREKFRLGHLNVFKENPFDIRALGPFIIMALSSFPFGVLLTLGPDLSMHLGFHNKGLLFGVFSLTSILIRFFAGKYSDKVGRKPLLYVANVIFCVALIMIARAESKDFLIYASLLFGLALGMNAPSIFAWAIDVSHPERRGKALATVFMALEIGIGLGAFISGEIYNNDIERIPLAFYWAAGATAFAVIALIFIPEKHPLPVPGRAQD